MLVRPWLSGLVFGAGEKKKDGVVSCIISQSGEPNTMPQA